MVVYVLSLKVLSVAYSRLYEYSLLIVVSPNIMPVDISILIVAVLDVVVLSECSEVKVVEIVFLTLIPLPALNQYPRAIAPPVFQSFIEAQPRPS